jgi:hypothetical protein
MSAKLKKPYTPQQLIDGIFALHTRRFGTVAEVLVKIMANANWGKSISHDLYDEKNLKRIEVKFSRALRKNISTIKETNILEQIVSADDKIRMFASTEWEEYQFDCNIQQIKRKEFEVLYYGIFFSNVVQIFKIRSSDIGRDKELQYSDKQHSGNVGEGQFHLNKKTYVHHKKKYFKKELTYEQILDLLVKTQNTNKF